MLLNYNILDARRDEINLKIKTVKKVMLISLGGLLLVVISIGYLLSKLDSAIEVEKNEYKEKLGEQVILGKDTLTVIDYSSTLETFTLSNDTKINSSLILK